jgi:hypothetical protein
MRGRFQLPRGGIGTGGGVTDLGAVGLAKMPDVLFVSWCPLKVLRPRALQVGRAGKALRLNGWAPHLICSEFSNLTDLFDRDLERLYRPSFASVTAITDPNYMQAWNNGGEALRQQQRPKLLRWVESKFRKSKPPQIWTEAAARATARWVHRRRRPTVISFGQPWESHLAALVVKRAMPKMKWAALFSDPWADNPYVAQNDSAELEAARKQEHEVITQADFLIFVSDHTADLVMQKYPLDWREKVRVIPHLLDLEVMPSARPTASKGDRLRLLHAGSLYAGKRLPNGLFTALHELNGNGVEFQFVGWAPTDTIKQIRESDLKDCIFWTTPLYYKPCLAEMANADVLVVIDADFDNSPFLPSKIFDYLLFDKPMLGLTPPGSATSRFLERLGYPSVGPNDVLAIKNMLLGLQEAWRRGELVATKAHRTMRGECDLRTAGRTYVQLVKSLQKRHCK